MIKVLVTGAAGRMGREVSRAVWNADGMELVGAVDPYAEGVDVGKLIGLDDLGVKVRADLPQALDDIKPEVMIDFTTPDSVYKNVCTAISRGVRPVVGTTGMSGEQIDDIKERAGKNETGCILAPNFAIGALLMIKFAAEAAKYLPWAEIIELHHEKKLDAPSGTAVKTAEAIAAARISPVPENDAGVEKITGARGAKSGGGVRIHSVRLQGMMAHQEVIFGGLGQTLSIRHDTISRESFMPGVIMAVRKVMELKKMVYGLENIIFEK